MPGRLKIRILLLFILPFGIQTAVAQIEDNEIKQKIEIRAEKSYRNSIENRLNIIQYNFVNPRYNPYEVIEDKNKPGNADDLSTFSFGLSGSYQLNNPATFGAYFTIKGEDLIFVCTVESSTQPNAVYYDNIANQYIEYWNDIFLGSKMKITDIGVGVGKNIVNKYFPYLLFSAVNYREYLIYFDDARVLSQNGKYAIPGIYQTRVHLGVGLLYQISIIELKTELDIVGTNRINLGIGIQL